MTHEVVSVNLDSSSYRIAIGKGLLARASSFLPFSLESRALFVLTDQNAEPYAQTVLKNLQKEDAGRKTALLTLPAGEGMKSFAGLERVVSWLLDSGVERESVLFAVGGGVIGDLGGFAAATVMRGIPVVQIPTTLLSQVDSAVGGKTAINTPQGKNLVGVFHQPCAVICDTDVLASLPRREILAGYAEIVKYALIDDPGFFSWLETEGEAICALRDAGALEKAIETSCRKKAAIVSVDEREQGARALLNLGHTFGHALEAASGYDGRLLHGEAVAIGIALAFRLSVRLGWCPDSDSRRVESHLSAAGLPVNIAALKSFLKATPEDILSLMKHDKKAQGGSLVFILAEGIGKARIAKNVSDGDVLAVLEQSFSEGQKGK